jgi:hypothetical protein
VRFRSFRLGLAPQLRHPLLVDRLAGLPARDDLAGRTKSTFSVFITRSITPDPEIPHFRQLKMLSRVWIENRSVPPHTGHGPERSMPRLSFQRFCSAQLPRS